MRRGWLVLALALCLPVAVVGCGQDEEATTGSNSVTVEVVDLVGATGSELNAELRKNVDYGQTPPVWTLLTTTVTDSPFTYRDTVAQLPEGEFDLAVMAGSDGKSESATVKGQGCGMAFTLGKDETVTVSIAGLHEFGEKGYGECTATLTRS